jgi:hypothetical protein
VVAIEEVNVTCLLYILQELYFWLEDEKNVPKYGISMSLEFRNILKWINEVW